MSGRQKRRSSRQRVRVTLAAVVGVALAVLFGVRAGFGIVGGAAYAEGKKQAALGNYARAEPYLSRAIAGDDPAALHWIRGQVRHGLAKRIGKASGRTGTADQLMREAFEDYALAIATSPASGWYWSNLAEIYQEVELLERAEFPVPLELTIAGHWALVGHPGRVAIGMSRIATSREPNTFALHDRLADIFFDNNLIAPGLDAVRESARVQPIYYLHPYRYMASPPDGLLDAFAEASRAALDSTPLLRTGVHLTALGRLEVRRENWEQAVADLRAALELPGHELDRAEARYWMGVALGELGRNAEAVASLEAAMEHPNLTTRSLEALATIAERQGDLAEAMEVRRQLHHADRRQLSWLLDYARVARLQGELTAAEDALRWGVIVHPEEPRLRAELVGLYLEQGDLADARLQLRELDRFEDVAELVAALRDQIHRAAKANPGDRTRP